MAMCYPLGAYSSRPTDLRRDLCKLHTGPAHPSGWRRVRLFRRRLGNRGVPNSLMRHGLRHFASNRGASLLDIERENRSPLPGGIQIGTMW